VRLTPRDQALLKGLARFRIARTSDLVRYAFRGVRKDTAAARLRRLYDAGYLEVRFHERAEENLYCLGAAGKQFVAERGVPAKRVPRGDLNHHVGIVKTWVDLATEVHAFPGVRLTYARPDWEIRSDVSSVQWPVIPDLLVVLGAAEDRGGPTVPLAVEVDLGTERMPALRRKVMGYAQARADGNPVLGAAGTGLCIVFSGTTAPRKHALETLIDQVWTGWWASWELEGGPGVVLKKVVDCLRDPLTNSPCGKGRGSPVTDDGSPTQSVRGQGPSQ
jgi:hypothetical protein